jgi:hypothetical protein
MSNRCLKRIGSNRTSVPKIFSEKYTFKCINQSITSFTIDILYVARIIGHRVFKSTGQNSFRLTQDTSCAKEVEDGIRAHRMSGGFGMVRDDDFTSLEVTGT